MNRFLATSTCGMFACALVTASVAAGLLTPLEQQRIVDAFGTASSDAFTISDDDVKQARDFGFFDDQAGIYSLMAASAANCLSTQQSLITSDRVEARGTTGMFAEGFQPDGKATVSGKSQCVVTFEVTRVCRYTISGLVSLGDSGWTEIFFAGPDGLIASYEPVDYFETFFDEGVLTPGVYTLDALTAGNTAGGFVTTGYASGEFEVTLQLDSPSADLDGDGVVGPADLAQLLGSWGDCKVANDCLADLDDDGVVGPADLAQLLGDWG